MHALATHLNSYSSHFGHFIFPLGGKKVMNKAFNSRMNEESQTYKYSLHLLSNQSLFGTFPNKAASVGELILVF